jgi:amidohydrolase
MQDQVHPAWRARLDAAVDEIDERIVAVRRRLHSHPELSGQETETTKFLAQELSGRGLTVQIGPEGRGLIADLGPSGPRVGLRADVDALPIHDDKQVEYRSRVPGVMHACGHDAHTAIVLGACLALAEMQQRGELPVELSLRAVFQPA